ncbi:conserved hypothetical protein [Leptospira interrogans serovar Manilae]|uniref:Uncharacterized protein n=1 Tax=Leptospira interrogans serovar Manilae TaxID=214675 RepID=A0AAQ1NV79_LEPIR|nr:hypothetical protein [Leptospira interrogans]AKP27046.1 hypothetical protein LIMLP_14645 [Leptospira interrogans serovar Manilae]AKP30821.1 hypothetical protein LIMHP_14640 [Leptospira interrogans serovar Manilae]EYU62664.1 hypothetical protein CI00_19495 [Leptospira interrogans serovar Manilae]SOR60389.1 conserved hypothetical protein [Leptospira interrogans serovar Manilae]
MKRVVWKEGDLVSLKLKDDLYTFAQMLCSPYMRFFDLSCVNGDWKEIDFAQSKEIFCVLVGQIVLQKLVVEKIRGKSIQPYFQKYWIRPRLNFEGGFPLKGGDLVEVDPNVGYVHAPIVQEDLSIIRDLEIIQKYELVNMWGAKDLSERLVNYFETGRNSDSFKEKVFGIVI